jgi:hypothetical protein
MIRICGSKVSASSHGPELRYGYLGIRMHLWKHAGWFVVPRQQQYPGEAAETAPTREMNQVPFPPRAMHVCTSLRNAGQNCGVAENGNSARSLMLLTTAKPWRTVKGMRKLPADTNETYRPRLQRGRWLPCCFP